MHPMMNTTTTNATIESRATATTTTNNNNVPRRNDSDGRVTNVENTSTTPFTVTTIQEDDSSCYSSTTMEEAREAIRNEAKWGWLHVLDIVQILTPSSSPPPSLSSEKSSSPISEEEEGTTTATTVLPISAEPPSHPPPSGSIYLYDRTKTKFYRQDHYEWLREKNGRKVREDHVKLRVDGKYRVGGNYAQGCGNCHSSKSMKRRTYHLLGTDAKHRGGQQRENSFVLVHYLDTDVAKKAKAEAAALGGWSSVSPTHSCAGPRKPVLSTLLSFHHQRGNSKREQDGIGSFGIKADDAASPKTTRGVVISTTKRGGDAYRSEDESRDKRILTPRGCSTMTTSLPGDNAVRNNHRLVGSEINNPTGGDGDSGGGCSSSLNDKFILLPQPTELLPEVVDFSPEKATIRCPSEGTTKVLLATSKPLPGNYSGGDVHCAAVVRDSSSGWKTFAAFVEVELVDHDPDEGDETWNHDGAKGGGKRNTCRATSTSLEVQRLDVVPLVQRTPTAFKCEVPPNVGPYPGYRSVVIVGVPPPPPVGSVRFIERGGGLIRGHTRGLGKTMIKPGIHWSAEEMLSCKGGSSSSSSPTLDMTVAQTLQEAIDAAMGDATTNHSSLGLLRPTFFSSSSLMGRDKDGTTMEDDAGAGSGETIHILSQFSRDFFEFTLPAQQNVNLSLPKQATRERAGVSPTVVRESQSDMHPITEDSLVYDSVAECCALAATVNGTAALTLQESSALLATPPIETVRDGEELVRPASPTLDLRDLSMAVNEGQALASWLHAPRFDDQDEKEERQSISFEEMAAALADLHGAPYTLSREGRRHVEDVTEEEIRQFDMELEHFSDMETKKELLRALAVCPDQVSRRDKALFILTEESQSMADAAKRLCDHWTMRVEIFGEEKAFLPMTLSGALRDDWHTLTVLDPLQYPLPGVQDAFGRSILYADSFRFDPETDDYDSLFRAIWYMLHVASHIAKNPVDGYIFVRHPAAIEEWVHIHAKIPQMSRRMFDVFPIVVRAHHVINGRCWWDQMISPAVSHLIGRELRLRTKGHDGSPAEVVKSLSQYGMGPEVIPVQIGGEFQINIAQWLEGRKESGL